MSNGHWEELIIVLRLGVRGYYFLGREAVRLVLRPILGVLRREMGLREVLGGWVA